MLPAHKLLHQKQINLSPEAKRSERERVRVREIYGAREREREESCGGEITRARERERERREHEKFSEI